MNTILKYYLRVIFFIFPIAFIPIVLDGFGFGKNMVLGALAFVGLILWTIKLLTEKEKIIKTNKLFWLFLVFVIWSTISFFRLSPGVKAVSLMNPMGFGTIVSFFVLFFVWTQVYEKEESKKQFLFLTVSGLLSGLVSLLVFLIPANKLPLNIPKTNSLISITSGWSLVGSIWAEVTLFLFLIFGWAKQLLKKVKEKADVQSYLIEAIATIFFSLLFLLDIYRIIKTGWMFLDFKSAWVIAVEVFKNKPLFGIGIGNFVEAFNLYRPASFNLTANWSGIFSSSSMGILQIWTELGIVGLGLVIYLIAMVKKMKKSSSFGKLILFLAVSLLLPLNLVSVFLLIWILSEGVVESKESKLILKVGEGDFNVMPYVVAVIVLAGAGFGGYLGARMLLGDFYMRKSLVEASKNNGTKTYELQIKAIGFNPNLASYRTTYAQVNLSLAQALLNDKEISDENKEKASTLVQQAVREAKAAVQLDQKNPQYWYNLGGVYKTLVGLVDSAADWSYQAYQQAVALDPVNPTYYLDMGGLLYAGGAYENAARAFEESVTAKNNYANAWYNWAYASKQQNKLAAAVTYLEKALTLVPKDNESYEAATKELETWKAEYEKLSAEQKAAEEAAKKEADAKAGTNKSEQTQGSVPPTQDTSSQQLTAPETTNNTGAEEKLETPVSGL